MNIELLQLLIAKGSGESAIRRFLSFAEENGKNAAINMCLTSKDISNAIGLKPNVSDDIVSSRNNAIILYDKLLNNNIEMIWLGNPDYPMRLNNVFGRSSPPILFIKGNMELLKYKAVGFCGSRKASGKGLCITKKCCQQLVEKDYCIVSGYAHGVDMAAHRAAMENNGTTIIVLVEGILRFQVKQEIKDVITSGNHLIVSQFPPLLTWMGRNAMKRNGTIIGLSDAMVLVESGLDGGTFAAGETALRRKQPLFVIDYAFPGPSAEANPYFINKGGIPIRGNQNGVPNLSKLFEIASEQSLRNTQIDKPDLFSLKKTNGEE